MHYLITGGARGIGRALSRSLLTAGHKVFIIDADADELKHTATLLEKIAPSKIKTAHADISSRPALTRAVAQAEQFFNNRLDVLINNAMALPHTFPYGRDMISPAAADYFDRQISVGLMAPFHLTRMCTGMLSEAVGSVIMVSSTRATMAEENHEGYSAAKAGLLGLSQAMSVSLGEKYGIRVNSLVLGWVHVETECRQADAAGTKWNDGLTYADEKWHPAGRVGKAEDVLKAVEYLATAQWVTGTEMVLDGGVTRKMVYPE